MLGSTISVFSEPDDFRRALQESSYTELLIIEGGVFWARMTKIALHSLRLSSAQERLGRIASIAVPPGLIRVLLPPDRGTLICGGTEVRAGNLVTQCPGDSVHERLPGPCCWREIVVPARYLARYSRALTGSPTVVPPRVRSWQPPAGDIRQLVALHAAATRVAETHAGKIFGAEAARGLEQELIACLVECLSGGALETAVDAADRHAVIVARFEQMVSACPDRLPPLATVCAALGVATRTLRQCCHDHLGMGPSHYLLLRRLQRARYALRSAGSEMATVSDLARQHGFRELGRFAASYRALYGELPSTTLRRSMDG